MNWTFDTHSKFKLGFSRYLSPRRYDHQFKQLLIFDKQLNSEEAENLFTKNNLNINNFFYFNYNK